MKHTCDNYPANWNFKKHGWECRCGKITKCSNKNHQNLNPAIECCPEAPNH